MKISVDDEDVMYDSEYEMCEAHGVSTGLFYYRQKQGLPLKECLKPYENPFNGSFKGKFVYKDVEYKSMKACCEKLDICYMSVYNRIYKKNMTPSEAIDATIEYKRTHKARKTA